MKQLIQDARHGDIRVAEVPAPRLLPGCVLVRVEASLVSPGTERAVSEFASKGLLQKAVARPDLVRGLLAKVRRDGLLSAIQVARSRLDQPMALGYSSAGTVNAVAPDVTDIRPGDRVACAGAGRAVHAEWACVPRLLLAKIPEPSNVSYDQAAFTTLGAVALHGIRCADVKLGDVVAVIGLGLVGQLTAQLLKAAGCRVLGLDLAQERADIALRLGSDATSTSRETFRDLCGHHSGGIGVDSVLITAETPSSDPVNLAAEIARDRATVVAVGTVGMDIDRKLFYAKEIDFRVSRSYGPGRYDSAYEQKGRDYPIGYVRWTETRNMEAFLRLLAEEKLKLEPLITHRFPIDSARNAYDLITGRSGEAYLGVLLNYAGDQEVHQKFERKQIPKRTTQSKLGLSVIGAGNFATRMLLPAIKRLNTVELRGIASATGIHARHAADKFDFEHCTANEEQILADPQCDAVMIATRHHLHAAQVLAALAAGKHVFCEKPLCLREDELFEIVHACAASASAPRLMVGFNRRFAPRTLRLKSFFAGVHEPLSMHYRINAGSLPPDHWINDPEQGGGRILGELCHFVDLLSFIAGTLPTKVYARALAGNGSCGSDTAAMLLDYANGSQATISYVANGDRALSKERLEIFGGGRAGVLEDFRRLEMACHSGRTVVRSRWRQDKGHRAELRAFVQAALGGTVAPISLQEIAATTLTTFRIQDSLASGEAIAVNLSEFLSSALKSSTAGAVPA